MKRWYLLYCKRGDQERAQMHLENQGVEVYYPKITVEKMVRGKRQKRSEPLFPSYMFVRFDFEVGPSFTTVRSTRGVSDFIRNGVYPTELQGDLVYTLKQVEGSQEDTEIESDLLQKGDEVIIKSGQFAGVDAIYHEADGEKRSILLITMINKKVEVHVDNQDIEAKS
ncbi:transcription/translation regulatory transformer protein RfaH [Vibrio breoganii]|uniref:transcription/translation regulatory transformer protein RfaH n=1 Tax=Vibrio breoganii TaxID=553239 RepID=UPI0002FDD918|nr:transcription/translation regulatory transformer protein RfaH [Vibrio breoganii]OED98005.1 transcriptional activator RfaH [Vibrio breoganii ZF-29]OEF88011.1 transcriptional activator RfaH [Vibrio breoganii 1C10]PMM87513.1 transcriptional activator RfaH [Vibrio breoganii]TKF90246.1 transcription/translation regulatory transformer protein RfaH [Vibrio breoganii]